MFKDRNQKYLMNPLRYLVISLFFFSFIFFSCRKEEFTYDASAKLEFSTDEVLFDTVFTKVGSVTRRFKVYNRNDKSIVIDKISLEGGNNSPYRINIDGQPAKSLSNYEVSANDSFYIFVEVTIDPNGDLTPFLVKDSIRFVTNGNNQFVNLTSYGRYADHYNGAVISNDTTWTSESPKLIYDYVVVDSNVTLTIEKGTEIYSHGEAGIFVFGTLKVKGKMGEEVMFQGDRLEDYYNDVPGQWLGIRLLPSSHDNKIDYAIIRNAVTGLELDSFATQGSNTKLWLTNTVVENMSGVGIAGFSSILFAANVIVDNCCQALIYCPFGGKYQFIHCSFAGISCVCPQEQPSYIFQSNAFTNQNGEKTDYDLVLSIYNSILWGNKDEELVLGLEDRDTLSISYSLLKTKLSALDTFGNILNKDPLYEDGCKYKFTLKKGSPAIGSGGGIGPGELPPEYEIVVEKDIMGNQRDKAKPDMGAIEFQE